MSFTNSVGGIVMNTFVKTSGSFWVINASGNATANTTGSNNYLIICLATDNITTTDGNTNDHQSMNDNVSGSLNVYSKVYEYTNGNGAAGSGVTTSIWTCPVKSDIVGTVTAISIFFSANCTAKAIFGMQFVNLGTLASQGTPGVAVNDTAQPGAITLSGLTTGRQYLFIRAQGHERPSTDVFTKSTNFTDCGKAGSTGGGATTNMTIDMERFISTTTSATSQPSWGTAANEAAIMAAFYESAPPPRSFSVIC